MTASSDGLTAVTGPHAAHFQSLLESLDLKCTTLSPASYHLVMYEKLMWISSLMLVGAAKQCPTVGSARRQHLPLLTDLIEEMMCAVEADEGILFPDHAATITRLTEYTDVVSDFPAALKEHEWRNKRFADLRCSLHNSLLAAASPATVLPRGGSVNKASMRQ